MNRILNNPTGHFEREMESRFAKIKSQHFDGVKQISADDLINDYSLLLDSVIQYLPYVIEQKKIELGNNKHVNLIIEKSEELVDSWNDILEELDFVIGKTVHHCI